MSYIINYSIEIFENAHNAFSDVATIECFKELKKKGVIDMSDDNDNLPF